jgi:hypothetical protein
MKLSLADCTHSVRTIGSDAIHQNSTITIAVKEPEVEHKIRIRDFENWLSSNGKSPAEQALKTDLLALLSAVIEEKPLLQR